MKTRHRLHITDARTMPDITDESVQLVVTSPPYPMIGMWDPIFSSLSPTAGSALEADRGLIAFEAMHSELDRVWAECHRVLSPGGFACINIGDATRSMGGEFRLFHNHARVISGMVQLGFTVLPDILWRKPTNAPNKFMGSGMLPAGAYVTYEHEYILVFRKGNKRVFRGTAARENRSRSAFFWEERNRWFSDLWTDLRGTAQQLRTAASRDRSAAFPFDLPYRLIQMYSAYGDTVLDPFVGTGSTLAAAVVSGRSSIGVEISASIAAPIAARLQHAVDIGPAHVRARLDAHERFVQERQEQGKTLKHHNTPHDVPVITRQEQRLELLAPLAIQPLEDETGFEVHHGRLDSAPRSPENTGRQATLFEKP